MGTAKQVRGGFHWEGTAKPEEVPGAGARTAQEGAHDAEGRVPRWGPLLVPGGYVLPRPSIVSPPALPTCPALGSPGLPRDAPSRGGDAVQLREIPARPGPVQPPMPPCARGHQHVRGLALARPLSSDFSEKVDWDTGQPRNSPKASHSERFGLATQIS